MNGVTLAYLLLVINQLLAGGTFLVMYVSQSGWRGSPVARHVVYWVAATCVVDLSWLVLLIAQWQWLVYGLLAAQALVGVVGWQRVVLLRRPRHDE